MIKMRKTLDFAVNIGYNIQAVEYMFTVKSIEYRGVAKFGIALGSGPRGHGFESRHSDQKSTSIIRCLSIFTFSLFTFH